MIIDINFIDSGFKYAGILSYEECRDAYNKLEMSKRAEEEARNFAPWSFLENINCSFNPLFMDGEARLFASYLLEYMGRENEAENMRHSAYKILQMAYGADVSGCYHNPE